MISVGNPYTNYIGVAGAKGVTSGDSRWRSTSRRVDAGNDPRGQTQDDGAGLTLAAIVGQPPAARTHGLTPEAEAQLEGARARASSRASKHARGRGGNTSV